MDHESRVVVLIDMDCFYCQVEEKLDPELKGKPIAVVQYNPWKGGGIIAVNYIARAMGVTRHMRGDEAKAKCPEIQLPSVPCQRGKADTTKYREAGVEVAKVLQRFTPLLERASVDEAYMDITASVEERLHKLPIHSVHSQMLPNAFALGYDNIDLFINDINNYNNENIDYDVEHTKRLLIGAVIVSEVRAAVYNETGYQCSAGIAHNKILAKLVCGMNKPNKQTILPKHSINTLYRTLPLKKVKHLGGKFGDTVCDVLKISKMGELQCFTEKDLQNKFDIKNGTWLYNIARGIDQEPVQAKFNSKSIGCCKQFRGKSALTDLSNLRKWLKDLADEIVDRLEKDSVDNNRSPKQMVVSYATQLKNFKDVSSSRTYNFTSEDDISSDFLYNKAIDIILESIEGCKIKDNDENGALKMPIKFLGISVGKFEDNDNKKTKKIIDYFSAGTSKDVAKIIDNKLQSNKKSTDKEYIIKKFFKVTDKNTTEESRIVDQSDCNKENHIDEENHVDEDRKSPIFRNSAFNLDQQESFFAKYLKHNLLNNSPKKEEETQDHDSSKKTSSIQIAELQESVTNCSENSNDSNYSASTINEEINKSICLEGDPDDVVRISELRGLLNHSIFQEESNMSSESEVAVEQKPTETTPKPPSPKPTTICEECGKTIPTQFIVTHSDYHLAVKLRREEREVIRQEMKDKTVQKPVKVVNDTQNSITKFVTKLDSSVPKETCSECGKKVPVSDLQEHKDFHEAQRLSRLLNNKSTIVTTSVKRKRNVSPIKKTKIPCRPINTFFR